MAFYSALRSSGLDNAQALANFKNQVFTDDLLMGRTTQYHQKLLDH